MTTPEKFLESPILRTCIVFFAPICFSQNVQNGQAKCMAAAFLLVIVLSGGTKVVTGMLTQCFGS